MDRFNLIYKELGIALEGLKKGILEIAITTSENTQVAKLLFRVFELEKKIDKIYIDTGKMIYELRHLTINEILENKNIKDDLTIIKAIQQDIHKIEKEINLLREDSIKSNMEKLRRYMRRGGYTIEELIVDRDSVVTSKEIGELKLPPGVMIISVIHHDLFLMPEDSLSLSEGDRVFILGSRDKIAEVAPLFTYFKQHA